MPRIVNGSKLPVAIADTAARSVQPTASSQAAAAITSAPSGECCSPISMRIRPRIGIAVIDIAVPMKRANDRLSMAVVAPRAPSRGIISHARPIPRQKGATIPATLTVAASRPWRRMWEKSNSIPMRNRSRISPTWLKAVSDASSPPTAAAPRGKTRAESSGATAPKAEGPRSNPAEISPTTLGWRSQRATTAPARAASMITTNCTSSGRSVSSRPAANRGTSAGCRNRSMGGIVPVRSPPHRGT